MPTASQSRDRTGSIHALTEALFYLALSIFFTHELDAVLSHEWRVMPLLKLLPDKQGMMIFVATHIPLFAGITAAAASRNQKNRRITRLVICMFLVFHAGLHYGFSGDPAYEFDALLSSGLIYGGAATGALYLLLDQVVFRFCSTATKRPG